MRASQGSEAAMEPGRSTAPRFVLSWTPSKRYRRRIRPFWYGTWLRSWSGPASKGAQDRTRSSQVYRARPLRGVRARDAIPVIRRRAYTHPRPSRRRRRIGAEPASQETHTLRLRPAHAGQPLWSESEKASSTGPEAEMDRPASHDASAESPCRWATPEAKAASPGRRWLVQAVPGWTEAVASPGLTRPWLSAATAA